jgi:hypothetical protein
LQSGEGAIGGGAAAEEGAKQQQRRRIKLEIGDALIDVRTTFATQGSLCSERLNAWAQCTSACREMRQTNYQRPLAVYARFVFHRLAELSFGSGFSVPGTQITPALPYEFKVDRLTVSPLYADKVARPENSRIAALHCSHSTFSAGLMTRSARQSQHHEYGDALSHLHLHVVGTLLALHLHAFHRKI